MSHRAVVRHAGRKGRMDSSPLSVVVILLESGSVSNCVNAVYLCTCISVRAFAVFVHVLVVDCLSVCLFRVFVFF